VAIPFPIHPRRIVCAESAKILDFIDWKHRHCLETSGYAERGEKAGSLEELEKLSLAEQQIWVIRRLLEVYDSGDSANLSKLYEILCHKSPDSA
jgi:hypothetical protein